VTDPPEPPLQELRRVELHGALAALRWFATRRPARWPRWVDTPVAPEPPERVGRHETAFLLVNHSTLLLQAAGWNVLTDPIWSRRCSPLPFAGPHRVHAPGLRFEDLPPIDVVLLSHDHYDHCDLPTLRRLSASHPEAVAVTTRGNDDLLRGAGFARVTALDWWQGTRLDAPVARGESPSLEVHVTPAAHFSGRGAFDRNRRWWGGFWLAAASSTVYYAGDTGYRDSLFRAVRERLGAPALAFLPIGAYLPRWFMGRVHLDPDDAVRAHRDLGATRSVGIHWGTFQLTDEAREQPLRDLERARERHGVREEAFQAGRPGTYRHGGG
jgi:L-ascorbate metabolism protein UlaG (beta-lactamase superfamily)